MKRWINLAVVALPLVGLTGLWFQSDYASRQGTDWEVPIQGYDPRDLLRGHYIQFTYDWPGQDNLNLRHTTAFCLVGAAPVVERIEPLESGRHCANPIERDTSDVYGRSGLQRGRLYVPQTRAAELEYKLRDRDQRGIVTIRVRKDGSFRPLSIRFRNLTAEEAAERAQPAELEPSAPAVMIDQETLEN